MSVINLRQYTQAQNARFSDALRQAKYLIKIYNDTGVCCPSKTVSMELKKPVDRPEAAMRSLNDVIQAIMFSSGFVCVIKNKDKKNLTLMMRMMTEDEKTKCGYIPAPPMYEMGEEELDEPQCCSEDEEEEEEKEEESK